MPHGFVLKYNDSKVFGYLKDLDDFVSKVDELPEEVVEFHITGDRNDFLNWINDSFHLNISVDDNLPPKDRLEEMAILVESRLIDERKKILNSFPIMPNSLEDKIINGPKKEQSLFKKFIDLLRERV